MVSMIYRFFAISTVSIFQANIPTRFSTFSTGFSTWKSGFAYTSRNAARRFMPVSGKKSGHFAFYIKESRRIFFSFYSSFRLTIRSLSRSEKRSPEFSTERERRFFVWKKRGKLRFSTVCRRSPAESAAHRSEEHTSELQSHA